MHSVTIVAGGVGPSCARRCAAQATRPACGEGTPGHSQQAHDAFKATCHRSGPVHRSSSNLESKGREQHAAQMHLSREEKELADFLRQSAQHCCGRSGIAKVPPRLHHVGVREARCGAALHARLCTPPLPGPQSAITYGLQPRSHAPARRTAAVQLSHRFSRIPTETRSAATRKTPCRTLPVPRAGPPHSLGGAFRRTERRGVSGSR